MVFTVSFLQTASDIRIYAMSNQLVIEKCHQYIKYDTFYKAKMEEMQPSELNTGEVFNL